MDTCNLVPIKTMANGTAVLFEEPVQANTRHTLSWDAAADWDQPSGNLNVLIFARDSRPLLVDMHFLTPPIGEGNTDLQITRSAIRNKDLRIAFLWLVASGDPSVALAGGEIRGTSGIYSGQR